MNCAASIALLALAGFARAQEFPTKPVHMVVDIGPGSSMDIDLDKLCVRFSRNSRGG